jgi:hypothetical protein
MKCEHTTFSEVVEEAKKLHIESDNRTTLANLTKAVKLLEHFRNLYKTEKKLWTLYN